MVNGGLLNIALLKGEKKEIMVIYKSGTHNGKSVITQCVSFESVKTAEWKWKIYV